MRWQSSCSSGLRSASALCLDSFDPPTMQIPVPHACDVARLPESHALVTVHESTDGPSNAALSRHFPSGSVGDSNPTSHLTLLILSQADLFLSRRCWKVTTADVSEAAGGERPEGHRRCSFIRDSYASHWVWSPLRIITQKSLSECWRLGRQGRKPRNLVTASSVAKFLMIWARLGFDVVDCWSHQKPTGIHHDKAVRDTPTSRVSLLTTYPTAYLPGCPVIKSSPS